MVNGARRLRLPGDISQVREACEFVVEAARDVGMGEEGVFKCELSVEEIFTNIVEHGYGHDGSNKSIELVCQVENGALVISIIDEAPPFNPLELDDPDSTTDLWERDTGGWGVYFMRQYMDDILYRLENQRNHLILHKKIR